MGLIVRRLADQVAERQDQLGGAAEVELTLPSARHTGDILAIDAAQQHLQGPSRMATL